MADKVVCVICGAQCDDATSSHCSFCGERFHLNQRNDQEDKDCGAVWINDQYLALEFACQRCLDESEQPAARPAPARRDPAPKRRYRKRA